MSLETTICIKCVTWIIVQFSKIPLPWLKKRILQCISKKGWYPKVSDVFFIEFINEQAQNICYCTDKNEVISSLDLIQFFVKLTFSLNPVQPITISNITLYYPYPENYSYPGEKKIFINGVLQNLDGNYNLLSPITLETITNIVVSQHFRCCWTRVNDNFEYQSILLNIRFSIANLGHTYDYMVSGALQAGGNVSNINVELKKLNQE